MSASIVDAIKQAAEQAKAKFDADMAAAHIAHLARVQTFENDLRKALAANRYPQEINIRRLDIKVFEPVKAELEQQGFVVYTELDTDGPLHYYDKLIIKHWRPPQNQPAKSTN